MPPFATHIGKSVLIPLKKTFQLKHENQDLQWTWRFVNETGTVHKFKAIISQKKKKKPDMYLPLLEKFLKIFIHESKYWELSL